MAKMNAPRSLAPTLVLLVTGAVACGTSQENSPLGSGGVVGAPASGGAGTGGSDAGAGGLRGDAGAGGTTEEPDPPGACGVIETFEEGATPSREIFVDASATEQGDGSAGAPHTTLAAAFAAATPGTAIRIRPGTYAGGAFASNLAGTAEAPIWIGGVSGQERPVISGGSNAFQLSRASFVIVHDLEITGQTANGLNVDDGEVGSGSSHDLIFRDLSIHDIGSGGNQDCLKLSGIDRFYVLDSQFSGCSDGSAIDQVGCHEGVIARNVFSELRSTGVQAKGGSDDILVTQNLFIAAGQRAVNMGGSTGFEFFRPALSTSEANHEARNIRVVANLFRGSLSPIAFVGCVDCLAANNTIVDPERWVVRILQETVSAGGYEFTPAKDGRFINNIIYYSADLSTHVNVGGNTEADSFVFSNNLWYAHDAPASSTPSLPVTEAAGVYGEDPGFLSESDVSIGAESPAAGAGIELDEVSADLRRRCYQTPPTIGASEVE